MQGDDGLPLLAGFLFHGIHQGSSHAAFLNIQLDVETADIGNSVRQNLITDGTHRISSSKAIRMVFFFIFQRTFSSISFKADIAWGSPRSAAYFLKASL
jgi:hypothetical protein